ncbi:MAG TPA: CDP-diacylglycerol--glycerol-3-phosphate 3-phosphatidyltransferase, partial [Spirochaetaceae bacterium]|nr:CDP-diacylglycerol--glycerol-3-phosphate 3-phosphatidyltransferase [Spirochaetaceae bacterium]
MTLPNRLTLSRFVLTPVFAVSFYLMRVCGQGAVSAALAVACMLTYCYMEITDLADGKIARKRGLVTDLGKLFDPFADSVMHLTFFSLFAHFKMIGFAAFYVILFREVSILFIRMLSMKAGVVMPANAFGKFKTFFYALLSFLVIAFASVS